MEDHSTTVDQDHVAAAMQYALQVREDWNLVQLEAAVELCRRHRDKPSDELIARCLMRAAADPSIRQPKYVPAARLWVTLDQVDADVPATHSRTPHECRHCGQPGSSSNPPAYCPSCGQRWDPIGPDGEAVDSAGSTTTCSSCGKKQAGRFDYCARCGARMAYARPAARPAAATPEQPELPID